MVSSCKFNYKVLGRKAEKERRNQCVVSHIKRGISFQRTSFISPGKPNVGMPFELRKTQGCTLGRT